MRLTLNLNSFLCIFIITVGLFVHSFVLPSLLGFNLRLYFLIIILYTVFKGLKIPYNSVKIVRELIPLYLFWFFQLIYLFIFKFDQIESHLLTMLIITIFIIISVYFFSDLNILKVNANKYYKSVFLVFIIGLLLYAYLIISNGAIGLWLIQKVTRGNEIKFNYLLNFVFMDGPYLARNCGYYISPNFWAGFCIFAIFFLLFLRNNNISSRFWFITSLVTVLVSFLLTFSRGSYLSLFSGLLILYFPYLKSPKKNLFLLVFGIVFFIVILQNQEILVVKFKTIINKFNLDFIKQDARFRIWEYHLKGFSERAILGEGLKISREVFVPTVNPSGYIGSHNVLVNILNNSGVIGLLVNFIVFGKVYLLSFFKMLTYKNNFYFRFIVAILTSIFVYSLFEHAYITLFFWNIVIFSMAVFILAKKTNYK